ncbi:MAG: valine--tRNA ligase, partial [Mesorhizobium amorphae]
GTVDEASVPPRASAQIILGEATVCLPLGTLIDLGAEAERLRKELAKVTQEIARLHGKLANERFVANAPAELVEAEREKLAGLRDTQTRLDQALARLREGG